MAPDPVHGERARRSLTGARLAAGAVFVIFGLGKFLSHASELSSFETYGIPWPMVMVYLVGVLEVVGGLALLAGVAVAPVALLMAANMAVAIVVSGIGEGEVVPSLTLAPVLLIAMGLLLWTETRSRSRPHAGLISEASGHSSQSTSPQAAAWSAGSRAPEPARRSCASSSASPRAGVLPRVGGLHRERAFAVLHHAPLAVRRRARATGDEPRRERAAA